MAAQNGDRMRSNGCRFWLSLVIVVAVLGFGGFWWFLRTEDKPCLPDCIGTNLSSKGFNGDGISSNAKMPKS